MNYTTQFLFKPGSKTRLRDIDPGFCYGREKEAQALTARNTDRLRALQELLYAEHKRSLLVCLQAIDSGGKDGTIRHVLGAMNPQGCRVHSFKAPTSAELDHDYLWRAHRDAPARGDVAIFNRSYYEDVLIARVRKLVPKKEWSKRYDQINAMEQMLSENGTHIIKFFLHISKEEQMVRFRQRLDDPSKQWKIHASDFDEREYWDDYQDAFDAMLHQCSTKIAPWYVIPANHKWFRNLAVSQIMVDYMEGLGMQYPDVTADIAALRKTYGVKG